jgi:hypothetical protein
MLLNDKAQEPARPISLGERSTREYFRQFGLDQDSRYIGGRHAITTSGGVGSRDHTTVPYLPYA